MDRITHQPPRQQGYGSTSSLRNDSLKHTRKHERRREESNQETNSQALADCPATRGGLSSRATRTVRQCTADCPHRYGGPSVLGRGLSVKANRTSSREPRKTDRPRGARGLSARHPRTVRAAAADCPKPLPTKARNQNGSKAKPSKNTKNTRRTLPARTVCHHHADCPPYTDRPRNSPTPKVNTSNPSPDLPKGRSC
jgi:hypothetical protein